jgi:hypothetical protein
MLLAADYQLKDKLAEAGLLSKYSINMEKAWPKTENRFLAC